MNNIDDDALARVNMTYHEGTASRRLFNWLLSELIARCPQAWCSATQRYIGFYTRRYGRDIFAHLDLQNPWIRFGVPESVCDLIKPDYVSLGHFPNWRKNHPLSGFSLFNKEPEIIDVLEACYRARVDGERSLSRLLTKHRRATERLPMLPLPSDRNEPPARIETTAYRILRDTKNSRLVKYLHSFMCQICGHVIEFPNGDRYAEGHHIRPLGAPHNGPDTIENILCVCPNHHAELDYGILSLKESTLRQSADHFVSPKHLDYHNRKIFNSKNA